MQPRGRGGDRRRRRLWRERRGARGATARDRGRGRRARGERAPRAHRPTAPATIGDVHLRAFEVSSAASWHSHLQTNLISAVLLNNAIYARLAAAVAAARVRLVVVDITSLAAVSAWPSSTQVRARARRGGRSCVCELARHREQPHRFLVLGGQSGARSLLPIVRL